MVVNLSESTSIASEFLYELRHKEVQKDRARFRNNLKRLGNLMAIEISKKLTYELIQVTTPLAIAEAKVLKAQPVLITILRASLPLYDGFLEIYDKADSGFIGAYRNEGEEVTINMDYMALPDIAGRDVIFIDPMLATGKSLWRACEYLISKGKPRHVHFAAVVAAPEGIDYISKKIGSNFTIWTTVIDSHLNDHAYIVPGLGDAGDLCFGAKL